MPLDDFLAKKPTKKGKSVTEYTKDESPTESTTEHELPLEPIPKDEPLTESTTKNEAPPILSSEYLWSLLVETVENDLVLFPNLKAYVRDKILPNEPDITPKELALRLNISVGTAMVILHLSELKSNSSKSQ